MSSSRGCPRSRRRTSSASVRPHNLRRSSPPWPHPQHCAAGWVETGYDGATSRPIPQEGGHLACDRSHDHRRLLAGGAEAAIAGAKPDLPLPGKVADSLGQPLDPGPQGLADPGGVAASPCRVDQGAAGASIAGERTARPASRGPFDRSPGTRPRKAFNCGGVSKPRSNARPRCVLCQVSDTGSTRWSTPTCVACRCRGLGRDVEADDLWVWRLRIKRLTRASGSKNASSWRHRRDGCLPNSLLRHKRAHGQLDPRACQGVAAA